MKKYFKKTLILLAFIILVIPAIALAAANPAIGNLEEIGHLKGPYEAADQSTLSSIIGVVISAALALIGALFLSLMIYAGYHWMTARGEEEKVEKAKDTINRAIVGLIIVVGAYVIWKFIFYELVTR